MLWIQAFVANKMVGPYIFVFGLVYESLAGPI